MPPTDAGKKGTQDEFKAVCQALDQQKKWFEAVFNGSGEAIFISDAGLRLVNANQGAARLTGYGADELLSMPIADLHGAADRPAVQDFFQRVLSGENAACETRLVTKSGKTIEAEYSSRKIRIDEHTYIHTIARDITQRKRAEEELRQSEERYRAILDNIADGYFEVDLRGSYTFFNNAICRIVGSSREEMEGLNYREVTDEETARKIFTAYNRIYRTGEPIRSLRYWRRSLQGVERYVDSSVSLIRDAEGNPVGFRGIVRDITEQKRAETERERLTAAIEQSGEGILITDPDGTIQYVNQAFEKMTGYSRKELIGNNPRILKSGEQDASFYRQMWEAIASGNTWQGRIINRRKDGSRFTDDTTISPVKDAAGNIVNYVAAKRDITEKLKLEQEYRQAQKMESVGRLAGGVAHDFNNMLSVILGYAELAMEQVRPEDPLYANLKEILRAGRRSADIVRKLLAFARKQTVEPQVLDLNETVDGMLRMLRRLIGEGIELAWLPEPGLWQVKMDPTQVDQILANLCINARDAIGDVGKITIKTANRHLGEAFCRAEADLVPGQYVMLQISDNGCGMDPGIQARIFEPFFTTKALGKGTGLGLATVYGIVKQNNGEILVRSKPGHGAVFEIYLPRHTGIAGPGPAEDEGEARTGEHETILLVEDEPTIMEMAQTMLQNAGYRVLSAVTPSEAIETARIHHDRIHLLITDVIMPEMNGRELAKRLLALYPGLRLLFISGYTDNVIARQGVLEQGAHFLPKPFSRKDLIAKVREALK